MNVNNIPDVVLNILSLEDSVPDFELIHEHLVDAGYKMNISRVDKESQFISSLRNNKYDIILADFKLPGFNAFTALKWSKEICPDVPFICISGSIGEETAIELIKQGAVDYIIKDRLGRLSFAIKRALDGARERESKQVAIELLRASEERASLNWSKTFDAIQDGIALLDADQQIIQSNLAFQKFVNKSPGEFQDRQCFHFIHGTDCPAGACPFIKMKISRKRETTEMEIDGSFYEILVDPIFDRGGNINGAVHIMTDITERTRTEKILQIQYNIAREVVLAKSMEYLIEFVQNELSSLLDTRNFFLALYNHETDTLKQVVFKDEKDDFSEWKAENSLSGIVVKNAKTHLLKRPEIEQIARDYHLVLMGTRAECWLGVPLSTGDTVIGAMVVQSYSDPNAYDHASAALMEIIANELSTFIVRKSAEEKILLMNEELELHVAERTAQLQSAYQEMEAFSYTVSHDLRAPVRGIHGFTQILLEDYSNSLDEEGKRVCAVIQENALRMGQLIDDLLAFSRLHRTEMQKTAIDMKALANSVYHEITNAEKRLKINMTIENICDAYADPNLIKQVWTNLISNAIKYTSKLDTPVISISCTSLGNRCVYCIKDNGIGFDMKYKDKLFAVFQRLHNVKDFEGTGVGLASVKRIIQRHDGEVWAEGEVDNGAAFYFSLLEIPSCHK